MISGATLSSTADIVNGIVNNRRTKPSKVKANAFEYFSLKTKIAEIK